MKCPECKSSLNKTTTLYNIENILLIEGCNKCHYSNSYTIDELISHGKKLLSRSSSFVSCNDFVINNKVYLIKLQISIYLEWLSGDGSKPGDIYGLLELNNEKYYIENILQNFEFKKQYPTLIDVILDYQSDISNFCRKLEFHFPLREDQIKIYDRINQ